ncbi:MAG TPA: hypothetical protein VFF57_13440, partial [Hanamia sp.]|nr:hypothetical protein [Hanamia sp.]
GAWDGTMEHMDLWGYIVAALTFVVSIMIARSFDKNAKKEFENLRNIESDIKGSIEELKNTNKEIMKSTSNLEDATRNIIETLPGILDESLKIVEKVKGVCDRLLIMNYTSKFGLIHSFNIRFVNQIRDSSNTNDIIPEDDNMKKEYIAKKVNLFKKKIDDLEIKIFEASRRIKEFDLITLADDEFKSNFVDKYFETENTIDEPNLLYYPYNEIKEFESADIDMSKKNNQSVISQLVIEQHENTIKELTNFNTNRVTKRKNIPHQILLAEYFNKDKSELCFESMIIYAVDEIDRDQKSKKRNIIGISSKNKQMFKAFETLFNDVKNFDETTKDHEKLAVE